MEINNHSVLGIDACKDGWIVVEIKEEKLTIRMVEYLLDVVRTRVDVGVILVDIPRGLPESIEEAGKDQSVLNAKLNVYSLQQIIKVKEIIRVGP